MMMSFFLTTALLFILGACVGSFLNVLIYRTISGESWMTGRSHCDFCNRKIAWYDNIPLLSFLLIRGKSRCCNKTLSLSHPVVEFMTGTLCVWWLWFGSFFFRLTQQPLETLQPLFWLLVGILLLVILVSDLLYMVIPDIAVIALTVISLVYRVVLVMTGAMQVEDFVKIWFAVALGLLIVGGLWFITQGRGMGFGDVKFMVPMGLLLGWPTMLVGIFAAFIVGGCVAALLLLTGKKERKAAVPFGPFLIVGTILALVWGDYLWSWYMHLL